MVSAFLSIVVVGCTATFGVPSLLWAMSPLPLWIVTPVLVLLVVNFWTDGIAVVIFSGKTASAAFSPVFLIIL